MNSTLSALIAAFMAGIVQGTTGFGAGIVMMMVLPLFFALPQSAGISTAISIVICLSVAWRYRRAINLRKALIPSALYIVICSLVISFSVTVNQTRLKHVFEAFLLLLAAYYLFIARPDKRFNLNVWARLICISVSAACDGLFGIGGPLMVLYYMNTTATTDEYFGTLQTFFLMNSLWNTGFRLCRGILTEEHLLCIGIGMAGIFAGGMVAKRIVDKLDAAMIRRLIYVMIGISGVVNLIG